MGVRVDNKQAKALRERCDIVSLEVCALSCLSALLLVETQASVAVCEYVLSIETSQVFEAYPKAA